MLSLEGRLSDLQDKGGVAAGKQETGAIVWSRAQEGWHRGLPLHGVSFFRKNSGLGISEVRTYLLLPEMTKCTF